MANTSNQIGQSNESNLLYNLSKQLNNLTFAISSGLSNILIQANSYTDSIALTKENIVNKQNSLAIDGTGNLYPTVDAVNANVVNKADTEGARLDPLITPIYAWGDSFTAGSGFTPYTTYLADLTKFIVTNKGVSGETSTQIKDRLIADVANYSKSVIIWAGRNNYTSPSVVKADIATMISTLGHTRYLVVGIMNGDYPTEYINQSGWVQINQLNEDLKVLYGKKFVDIRPYIVSLHNNSAQDLIDFANDVPPTSLRLDNLHLNTTGYTRVAEFINKQLGELYNSTAYFNSKDFKYYFENNNPLHTIGDETFTGIKSSTNTTSTFTYGIRLTNTGISGSYVLSVNNNNAGDGHRVFNTSTGRGGNYDNAGTGVLLYLNSQTASVGDLLQFRKNGSLTAKVDQNGNLTIPILNISSNPTTSAGTYDVLTRNTTTGVVEKVTQAKGIATLVAGTVIVNTNVVLTGSIIMVSLNTPGGTLGIAYSTPSASIINGTSFVINSVSTAGTLVNTDLSTINWRIIN